MSMILKPLRTETQEATKRGWISIKQLRSVLERQNFTCAVCERPVGRPDSPAEFDHILPLELGGSDDIENIQALCREDHKRKTAADVKRIRKAARLRRDSDPSTRRKSPYRLRSRGFQKADSLK